MREGAMDLKIARGLALLSGLFFGGLAAVDLPPGRYAIVFIIPIAAALLALRWPFASGVMLLLASGYHAVVQYENYATMAPDAHPGAALANGLILLVLPTLVPGVLLVAAALRRRPRAQTVRRPV